MGELIAVLFRAFVLLILYVMARSLIRSVWNGLTSAGSHTDSRRTAVLSGSELKRDPVCGTFVSPAVSLSRTLNGETLYFCSAECRDRYRG
jgi:YHS domain-containing protein